MKLKSLALSLLLGATSSVALAGHNVGTEVDASKASLGKFATTWLDINQGVVHSFGNYPLKGWEDIVTVSGKVAADLVFSSRTARSVAGYNHNVNRFEGGLASGTGLETTEVGVPYANLAVDALVNCWTRVHVGLVNRGNYRRNLEAQNPTVFGDVLDEAYALIGNFNYSPLYVRAGRQYVDFGVSNTDDVVANLPGLLSRTRADALTLGYVSPMGLAASAYIYNGSHGQAADGVVTVAGTRTTLNSGGFRLGYMGDFNTVAYKFLFDWTNHLYNHNLSRVVLNGTEANGRRNSNPAWSFHASLSDQVFDGAFNYVTAMNRHFLDATTVWRHYPSLTSLNVSGAEPSAWSVDLGYSFNTAGLPSRFGVGYQESKQAYLVDPALAPNFSALGVFPKSRWLAEYNVELGRNTDLKFHYSMDKDYSDVNRPGDGINPSRYGSGNSVSTALVRLAVKFA